MASKCAVGTCSQSAAERSAYGVSTLAAIRAPCQDGAASSAGGLGSPVAPARHGASCCQVARNAGGQFSLHGIHKFVPPAAARAEVEALMLSLSSLSESPSSESCWLPGKPPSFGLNKSSGSWTLGPEKARPLSPAVPGPAALPPLGCGRGFARGTIASLPAELKVECAAQCAAHPRRWLRSKDDRQALEAFGRKTPSPLAQPSAGAAAQAQTPRRCRSSS